jgi:sec-independent protein translocase protein TatA
MINSPTQTLAFIGNFGGGEIILIFLIVLLLFGAKKVPELFRSLGKGVNDFKKAEDKKAEDNDSVSHESEKQTVS